VPDVAKRSGATFVGAKLLGVARAAGIADVPEGARSIASFVSRIMAFLWTRSTLVLLRRK
jgi:hypothetical protein